MALDRLDELAAEQRMVDSVFEDVPLAGKRVASFPADIVTIGARCFEAECVYLGAPSANPAAGRVSAQLREFDVDIFVVRLDRDIEVPDEAVVVTRSNEVGYVVYDLSPASPE